MENQGKLDIILKRRQYFNNLFTKINGCNYRKDIDFEISNTCPACGYLTLEKRCSWEICSLCNWEDDGQDDFDANKVFGGPNGDFSLTNYRIKFFDDFENFKNKNENLEFVKELKILDNFIFLNEENVQKVELQIEKVFKK